MIEQRGHATPALLATTPIPLTQGKYALVDSELAHIVSGHKWHYNGGYAIHSKYISITVHKAMIMHRHLWEVVNGLIPERTEIDHINGDRLDNRLKNLRVVTDRQQASN